MRSLLFILVACGFFICRASFADSDKTSPAVPLPLPAHSWDMSLTPEDKKIRSALTLTLTAEKDYYQVGEPVRIRATWKNVAAKRLSAKEGKLYIYNFEVTNGQGEAVFSFRARYSLGEFKKVKLAPQDTYVLDSHVTPRLTFTAPGKYFIQLPPEESQGYSQPVKPIEILVSQ